MSLSLAHYEAAKTEYPRWPGETLPHYAQRIAILAGAVKREDADPVKPDEEITDKRGLGVQTELRLPYKD